MNTNDLEEFLSSAYTYASTSKRTYRDVIHRILDQVQDPASLTAAELIRLLEQSGWGNARQCLALAAIKRYMVWTYGQKHPARNAKIKRVIGKPQRSLDPEMALKLLASFDPYSAKGARDLAICSLVFDTGLRESEVCRLEQADTDLEHRTLQVIVKGGQWEAAIFGERTAMRIDRWMSFRKIADGQGYLFTHVQTGEGLTPEGLYSIAREWGRKIGITLCFHDLRRSTAVMGVLNNLSERAMMELYRWKSPAMIKRYTRNLKLEQLRGLLVVDNFLEKFHPTDDQEKI